MYKVIYDDYLIDLIKTPKYVKFLYSLGKKTITDKTNANGIVGSDNKTVYVLQGNLCPEGKDYKTVLLQEIDSNEYKRLSDILKSSNTVIANPFGLRDVREKKIDELSAECNKTITDGVSVILSDNIEHHFRLTLEDQLNLVTIEKELATGRKKVLYHETGGVCKLYDAKDIQHLIDIADSHKKTHTTYFNLLKYCIYNMYDIDAIQRIQYGVDLTTLSVTDDIKQVVREWLDAK